MKQSAKITEILQKLPLGTLDGIDNLKEFLVNWIGNDSHTVLVSKLTKSNTLYVVTKYMSESREKKTYEVYRFFYMGKGQWAVSHDAQSQSADDAIMHLVLKEIN